MLVSEWADCHSCRLVGDIVVWVYAADCRLMCFGVRLVGAERWDKYGTKSFANMVLEALSLV